MAVKIAMIGTGNIASNELAPALNQVEGATLWSVLSRDSQRGTEFARAHQAQAPEPVHVELQSLIADPELDAVIIATPDKLHAEQAMACAAAGKHILVEKPMATDVDSAKAMVAASRKAQVCLAVAYHLRWHNGHRRLVDIIRAGQLGNLRHMRIQWTSKRADTSNWRAWPEVGRWWSLAGVGTHCLDLIRWVMVPACGEVAELKSVITRGILGSPHDETAVLAMRFDSGATAQLCTSVLFESKPRVEIYGDEGYAICEETLGYHGAGKIIVNGDEQEFSVVNQYAGEIRDFVAAIKEGRSPEVNGDEGARNVELLVAAISDNQD